MLAVILLTVSLQNCCPMVTQFLQAGYTAAQIEKAAVEHGVPRWVIAWAKRNCKTS